MYASPSSLPPSTTNLPPSALHFSIDARYKLNRILIDQRAHVVILIKRVANFYLPVSAFTSFCLKAS
jgi:hypothetical protein